MTPEEGYKLFRGRCKEFSDAECAKDPTLTLVRGHYFCPIWNRRDPHWWCKKPDGTIVDPTRQQYPSAGLGDYVEFDGMLECSNCGKTITEDEADIEGNYAFCCHHCHGKFVGVY